MNADRWQRVKSLFEHVLDLPERERAALLKESGESPSVISEVCSLLKLDDEGGEFLTPPDRAECADESIDGMLPPGFIVGDHFRSPVRWARAVWAWCTARKTRCWGERWR